MIVKYAITLLTVLLFSCNNGVTEIIELDKLSGVTFKYVLIKNPPTDTDSLKKMMVDYFKQKSAYIDSVYPDHYLRSIYFYRKTWETSYFIDHEEDPGGFSSYLIEDYNENIGAVFCSSPWYTDSTKKFDCILLYKKKESSVTESCDTLFWDCDKLIRMQALRVKKHITLDHNGRWTDPIKELNIIVKGDIETSVEALSDSLIQLSTTTFRVNVVHKAVGVASESDVMLALATDAIIIDLHAQTPINVEKIAEKESVRFLSYPVRSFSLSVIPDVIYEIKALCAHYEEENKK